MSINLSWSQDDDVKPKPDKEIDSISSNLEESGLIINDLVFEKRSIDPLAPSKAAFYSAVLPGLGQLYNKRGAWWKIPVVYGSLATGVGLYVYNDDLYNRFRDAYKNRLAGFSDDEFWDLSGLNPDKSSPDVSTDALQDAQERYQRDRDLWLLITIGFYALNIVEANVTAHLKQYNVDDNLSMDIKPKIDLDPVTSDPNYGLALVIKF